MRPSAQRLLSFLISLTFIVGAVFVYSALIKPSFENITQLRSEVKTLQVKLETQERNIQKLKELLAQFSSLESARQVLALTLPNDPNIPQVVNTVQGLASMNNVEISNFQTDLLAFKSLGADGPEYARNVGTVRSRVSISGNYDEFKKFVSQLEKNVRLMDVKELNITAANSGSRGLKFDVSADAYYQESITINQK